MPNMWIKRDISGILSSDTSFVEVLIGPRQCGKSSLFYHLGQDFIDINLDDLTLRQNISLDPVTFLAQYEGKKLLIDEAQLAPEIFSAIKYFVDKKKRNNVAREILFRLTGSNQILIDKNVKESLAGRASYFELNTLSVAEILTAIKMPVMEIIFKGGWPELYVNPKISVKRYLDDYIRTYIEKDIILSAGIQKQNDFMRFIKLLAGRTGHLINYSEFAKEVGVSTEAIKDWTSLLERMKIIILVSPFFSNYSKRLIKSSKIFFLDTGLACRLQGHSEIEPIRTSPHLGHLFESLVCAEIYKTMINFSKDWKIYHWRSRDGEEIDFYLEMDNHRSLFIEAKVNRQQLDLHRNYSEVKKVFKEKIPDRILCHLEGDTVRGDNVPISCLRDFLLGHK